MKLFLGSTAKVTRQGRSRRSCTAAAAVQLLPELLAQSEFCGTAFLGLIRLGAALSLGLIFILPVAADARAQGNGALVRPDPLALEVGQGQVETLHLILENAQEVYGIDVQAKFDPAVVEIVDADPASDGVQMIPGVFPQPDFPVRNTADNAAGTLMYVVTQVNPTPPVNGTGLILSIQFRGLAVGKESAFTIDFVDLVDRQGRKLSVQAQHGVIRVVPPKPSTATPPTNATPITLPNLTPALAAEPIPTLSAADDTGLNVQNTSPSSNTLLLALAGGGCLGALVLLVIAALVLLPPRSNKKRQ